MNRLRWLALLMLLLVSPAMAEAPRVHFDLPYTVACRDVTPPNFVAASPGQKLVEARLAISSLVTAGDERDLTQYFIRVESPERKLAIVDYLPKTSHESRLAGPLSVQDSKEQNATLGVNLSGKYELISGVGPSAGVGQKNSSCVKYDLLPPLETVAASGTLQRGSAAFFKLKSSPRNLLEGSREYALVLRVPGAWRADYVRVRCEAEGVQRGMVSTFDEVVRAGQREFLVALYLEGDEAARRTAEKFARHEAADAAPGIQSQGPKGQSQANRGGNSWTRNVPVWQSLR